MNRPLPRANYPLAQTLHPEQVRFLILHSRDHDLPTRWEWHFGSTLLRAYTDAGHRCTITAERFDELVRLGYVRRSGIAGAVITAKGRAAR